MWFGLVYNAPKGRIAEIVAKEIKRVGHMFWWQFQSFGNHDHPDDSLNDGFEEARQIIEVWKKTLSERFPEEKFIIEWEAFSHITWYQVIGNAPTRDGKWKLWPVDKYHFPPGWEQDQFLPDGSRKRFDHTERCVNSESEELDRKSPLSKPELHPEHRGVKIMRCSHCTNTLVHSTRKLRIRIGPFD